VVRGVIHRPGHASAFAHREKFPRMCATSY
jgi:hypothetical protein